MSLLVLTLAESEKWDGIVRSFSEYDTYWLSGYVKAFQIHGDGEPYLFYYEGEDVRAINVVMKRDIAKDKHFAGILEQGRYFDFSTPYGYGGWIIEGSDFDRLFDSYYNWAFENNIISEFVRFHPMIRNHSYCESFYEIVQLGEVVHMTLDSPESIWTNITSKNRNMIRKAVKNDINIYNGRSPEIYETFRKIYNGTMDKDNADQYYYFEKEFYTSVLKDLPHNAQVFYAEKDGKIIAASIILTANGKMNYHLSGSLKEYGTFAPTNYLLYEAAVWGSMNGYKTMYLGGGVGSGQDSLFKFKRAFYKGELNHFYIGKKVFNQQIYEELLHYRDAIDSSYFPKYRAEEH